MSMRFGKFSVVLFYCGERKPFIYIFTIVMAVGVYLLFTRVFHVSLPGGILEAGENPAEAAGRELTEETGYIPGEIHPLGSVYTSFGSSDERIHLFWTECTGRGESHLDDAEFLEVHLTEEKQFREMISSGTFMHGPGLAAWGQYLTRKAARQ